MGKRENGFSPVKSYFMTPEQMADMDRKVQEKNEGPKTWKWERTMTKEQYLQAVEEGRSREDIVLKHFNNDSRELRKQLRDWEMNGTGAVKVVQTPAEVKKEDYMQLRLNGEKRSQALKSLGIAGPKGYELLKDWGIREIDAEERELELLAPAKEEKEVDKRVLEQIEQNAEAEKKDDYIKDLEGELTKTRNELENVKHRLQSILKQDANEIARLNDALSGAAVISDQTGARIKELESERQVLLQTIEQAAVQGSNEITFKIPIQPVAIANVERARIYAVLEALSSDVEAAEIDRARVMCELYDLLQRVVNFVTADLAELHPGKEVAEFVQDFFNFYNDMHLGLLVEIRKAG